MENGVVFLSWLMAGLLIIFLPATLLRGQKWVSGFEFEQEHPQMERVVSGYTLVLIIWTPLSAVFTARIFQTYMADIFFLFVIFVPLIGIGLIKSVIEIVFGISSHLGLRLRKDPLIRVPHIHTSLSSIELFENRFTINQERIRPVGIIRLLFNTGLIASMIYFWL
ncbi:MAG: hypothetical protein KF770_11730 [Anaerolineae bacterium]|nr:hypothetical protein [Anaerolineae bacterium]